MTKAQNVVIIGAGSMGSAIALGIKRSTPNLSILIIDPDYIRAREMTNAGISAMPELPNDIKSDIMILAIPPQAFANFSSNNPQLEFFTGVIISTMAGITISEIETQLKTSQICRIIPNLPCALNEGTTVLIAHSKITTENNRLSCDLFSSLGLLIIVRAESLIDEATALVGGGPAYIAYFARSNFLLYRYRWDNLLVI